MRRTERKITGKGGTGPGSGGYLGTEPPTLQLPEGIYWGPGIPEYSPYTTHQRMAPAPQLMGLKGKGCRADLSGNNRKKRGEEGGGRGGVGHGGGKMGSQDRLGSVPQWPSRGGAHTHLSLGCPLLHPPTGPHPHTHHPHLKQKGQEVRGQQEQRELPDNKSRKPPLGGGPNKPPHYTSGH